MLRTIPAHILSATSLVVGTLVLAPAVTAGQLWRVVDTNQSICYDALGSVIPCPVPGQPYCGQDAQIDGDQPQYRDNGDGTVSDLVTGLMWQRGFESDVSWPEALAGASEATTGGYTDWRLPTIKELYSLILFSGTDPSRCVQASCDTRLLVPFLETTYFTFEYPDPSTGARIVDAQYWSATEYVSTTMHGDATVFGVNFADGRIKGYPRDRGPGGLPATHYVRYVRGPSGYGVNQYVDNQDGTITDTASGLMWSKADNGSGMTWAEALTWITQLNAQGSLGYHDWRLPNAKELQSIVDYSRSPATTGSAAIDPIFDVTMIVDEGGLTNAAFYWTSTTHASFSGDGPSAVYIAFGEALGWMETPPGSGIFDLLDVHGAGAQRSDPKQGDPASWPYGRGPQGDVVRILNFVRPVRDASESGPIAVVGSTAPSLIAAP